MRDDYTYNGLPLSKMATEDICECLRNGVCINSDDGIGERAAAEAVRKRLEIELIIRATRP
jgi:hypothetical protein